MAWAVGVPAFGSIGAHARLPKCRPHLGTLFAAGAADKTRLDVGKPDMIRPAIGAGGDVVAAVVVAAVDQHRVDTGCAQFAERDLLRVGMAGTLALFAETVNKDELKPST